MARPFVLKNYVVSQLRKASYRTPMYGEAKRAARVAYGRYRCAACQGTFGPTEVQVDHRDPVIDPITGWQSYDQFVVRLFCPAANLSVLCRPCHQLKSNGENATRRAAKGRA
jgi:5-methylcytosine-specific restriction endonuclease McrA